jgi:TPR repeat protein
MEDNRSEPQGSTAVAPKSCRQLVNEANLLFDAGNYPQAFDLYEKASSSAVNEEPSLGHIYYRLGLCKKRGKYLVGKPDETTARNYLMKAVELLPVRVSKGDSEAAADLGFMYDIGLYIPRKIDEALKLYTQSAEGGLIRAQYNLGVIYKSGYDVPRNMDLSIKFFKMAADQSDAESAYKLAQIYAKQKNFSEAFRYYLVAHPWQKGAIKVEKMFAGELGEEYLDLAYRYSANHWPKSSPMLNDVTLSSISAFFMIFRNGNKYPVRIPTELLELMTSFIIQLPSTLPLTYNHMS